MGIQGESTHRMTIFSPGDCWRGDPKSIAAQSERLLQGDREVPRLPIILDLWGNYKSAKEKREDLCLFQFSLRYFVKRERKY